jgi:hypothetical protein
MSIQVHRLTSFATCQVATGARAHGHRRFDLLGSVTLPLHPLCRSAARLRFARKRKCLLNHLVGAAEKVLEALVEEHLRRVDSSVDRDRLFVMG